jgi:hypothetical protein
MKTGRSSKNTGAVPDTSWKSLYGAGAVSALLYIVLIFVPIVLVFTVPQPPGSGGAAVLRYIASHKLVYMVELVCFVGLSVPAIVVFVALSAALKDLNKGIVAIGGLMGVASEIIALALGSSPPSLHGGLVYLSHQFITAAVVAQRAALASAAEGFIAAANAVTPAGILTAAGILILSLVMRKGVFHKAVAYFGIVTGVFGIVSEALRPMMGIAYTLYGILLMAWFIPVGWKLLSLGRR